MVSGIETVSGLDSFPMSCHLKFSDWLGTVTSNIDVLVIWFPTWNHGVLMSNDIVLNKYYPADFHYLCILKVYSANTLWKVLMVSKCAQNVKTRVCKRPLNLQYTQNGKCWPMLTIADCTDQHSPPGDHPLSSEIVPTAQYCPLEFETLLICCVHSGHTPCVIPSL